MAHAVVIKRAEKAQSVLERIGFANDMELFKTEFKKHYPDDWKRIIKRYETHERRDVKHKGHPMPKPEKYLEQMFKFFYNKHALGGQE